MVLLNVAIAHRVAGERSRVALFGSVVLALTITVQAGLGWAPGAVPTAVHVPLGVCIFAGSLLLSIALIRRRSDAARRAMAAAER
jgi:heme A synthase